MPFGRFGRKHLFLHVQLFFLVFANETLSFLALASHDARLCRQRAGKEKISCHQV
jgi:hypothetical protein